MEGVWLNWLEQWIVDSKVTGSSPVIPDIKFNLYKKVSLSSNG